MKERELIIDNLNNMYYLILGNSVHSKKKGSSQKEVKKKCDARMLTLGDIKKFNRYISNAIQKYELSMDELEMMKLCIKNRTTKQTNSSNLFETLPIILTIQFTFIQVAIGLIQCMQTASVYIATEASDPNKAIGASIIYSVIVTVGVGIIIMLYRHSSKDLSYINEEIFCNLVLQYLNDN